MYYHRGLLACASLGLIAAFSFPAAISSALAITVLFQNHAVSATLDLPTTEVSQPVANDPVENSPIRKEQEPAPIKANNAKPASQKIASSHHVSASNRFYLVRRGDSLSKIAGRFHLSVKTLMYANKLRNPHFIKAGQRLRIPTPHTATRDGEAKTSFNRLVETALKYRGIPYRYSGMTSRGFDCSGLVARVLSIHGIKAPHNSAALFKLGKPVTKKALQPGDLVFFHTTRRGISHVGIYIGDGKFVHSSSRGGKVQIDRLDSGYYQRRLVGARRVS